MTSLDNFREMFDYWIILLQLHTTQATTRGGIYEHEGGITRDSPAFLFT